MALTNNLVYRNLDAQAWYTKMIFGAPLLLGTRDFPGPFFTVIEGVKGEVDIPVLETDPGLQLSGCTLTPTSQYSRDPRTITTCKIAANSEICREEFAKENTINQSPFNQRPGAKNDAPSQTELTAFRDRQIRLIQRNVNRLLIQGNTGHLYDQSLTWCNGLLYRLTDTSGDPEETARVITVDGDVISSANVLDKMTETYEALDTLMIEKMYNGEENFDVRWLMHPSNYQMLMSALSQQNANYPALNTQTRNGVNRLYFNGIPIFPTEAMPVDTMIVYDRGNAWFATDLINDISDLVVTDRSATKPSDDYLEFLAKFYMGVAIKEGNFFTYYRIP